MEITLYDFDRYSYSHIDGQLVMTTSRFKGSDLALYAGLKTGSTPGFIVNTIAVIGGIVFGALYIIGGGD